MGRGATGWGRWGGGQRGGLDGERGNGEGKMEIGATGRGRWGGEMEMGGNGRGGISQMDRNTWVDRTYGMPGWNKITEFFDFVYPCNAGYPS